MPLVSTLYVLKLVRIYKLAKNAPKKRFKAFSIKNVQFINKSKTRAK